MQDIGCAVGSLIVFFFGEAIGRKRMIMSGAITMLIGTVRAILRHLQILLHRLCAYSDSFLE